MTQPTRIVTTLFTARLVFNDERVKVPAPMDATDDEVIEALKQGARQMMIDEGLVGNGHEPDLDLDEEYEEEIVDVEEEQGVEQEIPPITQRTEDSKEEEDDQEEGNTHTFEFTMRGNITVTGEDQEHAYDDAKDFLACLGIEDIQVRDLTISDVEVY